MYSVRKFSFDVFQVGDRLRQKILVKAEFKSQYNAVRDTILCDNLDGNPSIPFPIHSILNCRSIVSKVAVPASVS